MISIFPPPLRGALSLLLIVLNLVFWIIPFYAITVLKLIPGKKHRVRCLRGLEAVAALWIDGNDAIAVLHKINWDVRGAEGLRLDDWYLISSNHQSWIDVVALQHAFNRRVPFLRFFIKKELIWVPLLGFAWWGIELPFMQRHSKAMLEKNPQLRYQDLIATRKACEPCRERPTTILSFLEGTRFTPAKHKAQDSPFKNLLRPKVGGLALAMSSVGEVMKNYLDVTLVYSKPGATVWDLLCGRVKRVVIDIRGLTVPSVFFQGDYANDAHFRARIKAWVYEVWQAKDARIEAIASEAVPP